MANNTKRFILTKSDSCCDFFLAVDEILSKAASDVETIEDGTKTYKRIKSKDEIEHFPKELKALADEKTILNKYFREFFIDPDRNVWELTQKESDQLRKTVQAAHYYWSESEEPRDLRFEYYYNEYFKP